MSKSPLNILVVDDEPDLELVVRQRFRRRDEWRFQFRSNGLEALRLIEDNGDVDIVLADLKMPEVDGFALLSHLHDRSAPLKTVIVSAYGDLANIRKAMNEGAFDFLTKPINLVDLEATIEKTGEEVRKERSARETLDQLEATRKELEISRRIENLKSEFFANVSHEFRTPLTLLLGPIEDALTGSFGEPGDLPLEHLQMMRGQARRLKRMVNQILDWSRLEAGGVALHAKEIDPVAFVSEIVSGFKVEAERRGISLDFQEGAYVGSVWLDGDQIEKVVVNLLYNALKYTSSGGSIRIRVAGADAGGVEIAVRDNGIGIAPEELPHIFERFRRVEAAVGPREGAGIGLALSKEIVERHGGSISVESEPGFGTTFTVVLPRTPVHANEVCASDSALDDFEVNSPGHEEVFERLVDTLEPSDVDSRHDRSTVLVVEDEPDMRGYVSARLSRRYHVLTSADGQEALELLRSRTVDLVIADVMMPQKDGYELCRELKSDERLNHIPVILLTAKARDEEKMDGLSAGADDYICKPFNGQELLIRAENLISIRSMLRRRFSDEVVISGSDVHVRSADAEFLERVREVVEDRMGDPAFKVSDVAEEVGLSARQLRRRLQALIDVSPSGYVRALRLERARRLLEQKADTVSQIAYAVGFNDEKYFSRLFRQVYGILPSEVGRNGQTG